ncbi:glycine-rich RNA-binding protein RZ1C isoform X2 [Drosophila subpulchrella]|uniref:glycine-rich RNA-binding protein RZ1C isoform X2 n=1 Tax=Drosophila subpulchrella TaxID=1486046 RepID=UPI0018A12F8F|nr:glycine-rich RNA-binding protein RZ1C isoform X2 [Drosophila subpulchrella]
MRAIMLLSCLTLLVCVQSAVTGPEARSSGNSKDQQLATASVGIIDSVLRGKSRQSRCVRCYEDRDRDRYYSGYSSRTGDDMRGSSAWYYSGYDDRSSSSRDRDYDRYYDRSRYYDDRYTPRTYDRYEGRGYEDYRRGSGYGGSYDRERGYGYDNRDRYYGGDRYSEGSSRDRYSEGSSRDRYYDRFRSGGYERYDPYDRYYSSSSYGGRARPLGVSYLLERDADTPSDGTGNTASAAGNGGGNSGGGAGGQSMPIPAAQTAAEGSSGSAGQ